MVRLFTAEKTAKYLIYQDCISGFYVFVKKKDYFNICFAIWV